MVNINDILAPKFSEDLAYKKSSFVIYNNKLWISNAPVTPGPFNEDRWTEAYMVNLFQSDPYVVVGKAYYLGKIPGKEASTNDGVHTSETHNTFYDHDDPEEGREEASERREKWVLTQTKTYDLSKLVPKGYTPTVILANPASTTGYIHGYFKWIDAAGRPGTDITVSSYVGKYEWDGNSQTLTVHNISESSHNHGDVVMPSNSHVTNVDHYTQAWSDICVVVVI